MRARWLACVLLVAVAATPAGAASPDSGRYIVRVRTGLDGLRVVQSVCRLLGGSVTRSLDTAPEGGEVQPSSLFLIQLPPVLGLDALLSPLIRALGIVEAEPDLTVRVASAETAEVDQASAAVLDYLWRRTPVEYYGSTVWAGYLEQPAVRIVRLREAQCGLGATGGGVVAVVDTGIDSTHSVLEPYVVGGYDFTRNVAGGDEKADLGQASAAVLDGESACRVNQASAAVLDQGSAAVLDNDPAYAAFGHGTIVAGVVHLVAPTARLMPLKAFRADGTGYTSDIIRALYYATGHGAKVVNMSFSQPASSGELKRAVDNAVLRGLIPVSSAGNDGRRVLRYPAAYDTVMGIGSTDDDDARSGFSNYGDRLVWVAAPGEGIVTTYPFGTFAAAWGTSFSTPFVSGAAALLVGSRSSATYADSSWAVAHAHPASDGLGFGRLDLLETVRAGRLLWRLPILGASGGSAEPAAWCESR